MVRNSDGHDEPWLKVFVGHLAVRSITGWPRDVPPIFQQPLCSLRVLAVASVLDVGEVLLYDRQPRRVVPVAEGQRYMPVLAGSKHLARIQRAYAPSRVTELSLPDRDDNASADTRHTLHTLDLELLVAA